MRRPLALGGRFRPVGIELAKPDPWILIRRRAALPPLLALAKDTRPVGQMAAIKWREAPPLFWLFRECEIGHEFP